MRETCFGCDVLLSKKATERHHFPVPKRLGGTETVPLCISCHDMVDRFDIIDWPADITLRGVAELEMIRAGRLVLIKMLSRFP